MVDFAHLSTVSRLFRSQPREAVSKLAPMTTTSQTTAVKPKYGVLAVFKAVYINHRVCVSVFLVLKCMAATGLSNRLVLMRKFEQTVAGQSADLNLCTQHSWLTFK